MASAASHVGPATEPGVVEESSTSSAAAAAPAGEVEVVVEEGEEEEEEEGECGFCLFMKGGECKEAFVAWEECVEAAEKEGADMVERCFQATSNLKKCMDTHPDYYAPVLHAEKAVSDQAQAAVAADDTDKNNGDGSSPSPTTEEKKEDAVAESTAPAAASSPAAEETNKEEAVADKVESLSLSN